MENSLVAPEPGVSSLHHGAQLAVADSRHLVGLPHLTAGFSAKDRGVRQEDLIQEEAGRYIERGRGREEGSQGGNEGGREGRTRGEGGLGLREGRRRL